MRYEFAGCVLDLDAHVVHRAGQVVPVEPQVFDILRVLASEAGAVVSKDALIDAVWDGRIVSDATISARISAARAAVGDTGKDQRIIRTVSRRGFQMVAPVTVTELDAAQAPSDGTRAPAAAVTSEPQQVVRYTTAPDGGSIAWASAGSGPPVLYAWHHFSHLQLDWTSRLLRPALQRLAEHHRLVRFDIRGSGLSDPVPQGATLDACVAEMKAVADAAGLERFPIVATLQACAVAVRFAAQNPERVSRLVFHNAYARGRALREGAPEDADSDPFISLLRSSGWGDPENGFMRAFATMVLPMATPQETTELIRLISESVSAEDALRQRVLIDRFDVRSDLAQVRAPTRVIHARLCSIHPVGEGRRVAAGIPEAEFIEVDSSNTFLIASDPTFETVLQATRDFLSEDTASAAP